MPEGATAAQAIPCLEPPLLPSSSASYWTPIVKVRLPIDFCAQRLTADLAAVREEDWIAHYNPGDYEGDWSLAALRSPAGMQTNIWSCAIPEICHPTPLLERCEYFKHVLDHIPVTMSSARLMKLDVGAAIKEHRDSLGNEEIRIHVPVTTNPKVDFKLAGESVEMKAGSCWFLDFRLPHSVVNHGSDSRVHLVIDAYRNDWFADQLDSAT